jgi:hypothetical protein
MIPLHREGYLLSLAEDRESRSSPEQNTIKTSIPTKLTKALSHEHIRPTD